MVTDSIFTGVPTMCLLPLTNTKFKVVDGLHISIPRSGTYSVIAPEIFSDKDGEFDLFANGDSVYIPSITKVLLATGKYPALKPNQIFAPSVVAFDKDVVLIDGMILEILSITK